VARRDRGAVRLVTKAAPSRWRGITYT
jgi:hypothetical protein